MRALRAGAGHNADGGERAVGARGVSGGGRGRAVDGQRAVVRRRAGVETVQQRRDARRGRHARLPGRRLQPSVILHALPRVQAFRILLLEHTLRHGNYSNEPRRPRRRRHFGVPFRRARRVFVASCWGRLS